ncbi:hypothetical protein NFI96_005229 [Prochilodus magdalenae]|nr:hypothetical protein NFI96_005229 [Prochilodus magdalenae]
MLRTVRVNPQTSTKDLQHDLAADGVTVHRSTIRHTLHKEMLYGRVMQRNPFLCPHHKQSRLRCPLDAPFSSHSPMVLKNWGTSLSSPLLKGSLVLYVAILQCLDQCFIQSVSECNAEGRQALPVPAILAVRVEVE